MLSTGRAIRAHRGRFAVAAALMLATERPPEAAELKPRTIEAWAQYVEATEARVRAELADGSRFLSIDFTANDQGRALRHGIRSGDIVITGATTEGNDGTGIDVPSGMIQHWRGYVFIPGIGLDELLPALQDPTAHRQEDVIEARILARSAGALRLYLKIWRRSIVSAAYDTEHDVRYRVIGPRRAASRSISTRIAEIEELGTSRERTLPEGDDRGFLWRMNSYWRYEAVRDGVFVELESLTLSRDLPWGVRTFVRPIVNRVARESMARTLESTRDRFRAIRRAES